MIWMLATAALGLQALIGEWTPHGQTDGVTFFTLTARPGPSGEARVWLRFEYERPVSRGGRAVRSTRILTEYDCASSRSRNIQTADYAGAGLTGQGYRGSTTEWDYVPPNTIDAYVLDLACPLPPSR